MYDRLIKLIGEEKFAKLENKRVAIIGLGGVGGTVFEALVRSGVSHFKVFDNDIFEESNLNRQILSNNNNIGNFKALEAVEKTKKLNEKIIVDAYTVKIDEDTVKLIGNVSFIIDACDDIKAKLALVKYAQGKNIPIICALGTGKRLNPQNVVITTLNKTINDPLAKKFRYEMRKRVLDLNIPVVYSKEEPLSKENVIASSIFVPSTAGLMIAYYVFDKLIK